MSMHPRNWCPWMGATYGLGLIVLVLVLSDEGHLRAPLLVAVALLVGLPLLIGYVDWRFRRHRGQVPEHTVVDVYE